MEFLVEKIGMSRTLFAQSTPVTLLRVREMKICEVKEKGKAIVAYSLGKMHNKAILGQQKKYQLPKEFNRFATLEVAENTNVGDVDCNMLSEAKRLKITFKTKGRGFSGVMKRWNFNGGPAAHGHRFHRKTGSIGNREWPGRVQPGKKMAGQYGNEKVTVQNEILSYDSVKRVLVVKGSVPGYNGAFGKVKVVK